ncbi:MAG: LacI family DNA-binding transcriptional regulator [Opitutaceae bacterium]
MRPITQKDIARKLGLDDSTVSLALRNNEKITQTTRELVQKTAQEMGYRLNATAANLSKYRNSTSGRPVSAALAWLNCWEDPKALYQAKEYALYWKGAKETAERLGYNLEEFTVSDGMTLPRVHQIMQARGIVGILLPPHPLKTISGFEEFPWEKYSIVRFGRSVQYPNANIATADQFANMFLAYENVLKKGYKRIGMVNVQHSHTSWVNFDSGYLKAQEKNSSKDRVSIYHSQSEELILEISEFREWMDREQPDAIISATSGVHSLVKAAGYKVGTDIGLATMTLLDTTIDAGINQHSDEIGRIAVRNLIAQIQDNEFGIPKLQHQSLVGGEWVDGATLPDRS